MGKKKREHVVFDQMLKPKKTIPFSIVNKQTTKKEKCNIIKMDLKSMDLKSRRQWSTFMSTKNKDSNSFADCCKEKI